VDDPDGADLVVVGWGSTFGALNAGVDRARAKGHRVAHVHLTALNPLPSDLGAVLGRYQRFLVPELNLGQLAKVLRAEFLIDAKPLSKVRGLPFKASEIEEAIDLELGANS
jgi:2-oxoglutarate/2-oxoacid ferredoxin oxidoreductase subunit alpha